MRHVPQHVVTIHRQAGLGQAAQEFCLRSEVESVRRLEKVERLFGKAIPGKKQRILLGIPDRKGPHAFEVLDTLDDLGIGFSMARVRTELRDEFVSARIDERLSGDGIYLEVDDGVASYLRRTDGTPPAG